MKFGWTIGYRHVGDKFHLYIVDGKGRPLWFDSASEALVALEENEWVKRHKEICPYHKIEIVRCVKVGEREWNQYFMW